MSKSIVFLPEKHHHNRHASQENPVQPQNPASPPKPAVRTEPTGQDNSEIDSIIREAAEEHERLRKLKEANEAASKTQIPAPVHRIHNLEQGTSRTMIALKSFRKMPSDPKKLPSLGKVQTIHTSKGTITVLEKPQTATSGDDPDNGPGFNTAFLSFLQQGGAKEERPAQPEDAQSRLQMALQQAVDQMAFPEPGASGAWGGGRNNYTVNSCTSSAYFNDDRFYPFSSAPIKLEKEEEEKQDGKSRR